MLKRVKYKGLEDLVYRMQLTYDEIVDFLNIKYIAGSIIGYTLVLGVYEISDNNLMLKSLLLSKVKVNTTTDDIRLKSNLNNKKTFRFPKKNFFHTILGFTESQSELLGDISVLVQLIPGSYESERPKKLNGIDKVP